MNPEIQIVPYEHEFRADVIALWKRAFGYDSAHNEPGLVIDKKQLQEDGLFFVALSEDRSPVGTVMSGYDGHRGWIYSLAVSPELRRKGLGSQLMKHAMDALEALGCVKVNLQIAEGNEEVESFYKKLGFCSEKRISMGHCFPSNVHGDPDRLS